MSESEAGGMLAMSPEMVRYYSRRKRILMLVKSSAQTVLAGNVIGLWSEVEGNSAQSGGK